MHSGLILLVQGLRNTNGTNSGATECIPAYFNISCGKKAGYKMQVITTMLVLLIAGLKCTLVALHAAPW